MILKDDRFIILCFMARQGLLHFYPERIAWIGFGLLALGCLLAFPFLWIMWGNGSLALVRKENSQESNLQAPYSFSLGINPATPEFSIPDLREKITFSFDPPRPDGINNTQRLLVRIKETGENRRLILPCRVDLEFQKGRLKFASQPSLFWVDLNLLPNGQIDVKGSISALDGVQMDAGHFQIAGQDCPIQEAQEFPLDSPFRHLAEAKWWGRDLFKGIGESGERVEVGELLEIKENEWLIWKEGKWQKVRSPEKNLPIARIQSVTSKQLVLEGWDLDGHMRIGLNLAASPLFKLRGEDLFSAIRVRSEKQISCMLEKQCMVLKTGDWVFKTGPRWKVLRKKEEKDAFLNGKLFGELFILEQISQKQGQKVIQGRLFNPGRTQVVSIEMPAQAGRKLKSGKNP